MATAAWVLRGNGIEAWHDASVAVCTPAGLSVSFGDPELSSLTRSTIKPLQALALLTSGAADAFDFDARELALACSSHNGDDQHRSVARGMLDKARIAESALGCGAHLPIGMRIAERKPTHGEDRDPLRNNCSGKHAGFLALCKHLGEPLERYLDPNSATQERVLAEMAAVCEVDAAALARGTDGCSAPNYALPLSALARGMLRVASPKLASERLRPALERIRDAMLQHPELVSGKGRFDFALATSFPGRLLVKSGAEGMQVGAFVDPPLGFAIKVHDGGARALPPICISMLRQLGVLLGELPPALASHERPLLKNHNQIVTGEIRATLALVAHPPRA